jgi:hypothetical protein
MRRHLDRRHRHVQSSRDVADALIAELDRLDNLALASRQRYERLLDRLHVDSVGSIIRGTRQLGPHRAGTFMLSDTLLAPKDINETIAGDGIKPRCERPAAVERVSRMMHRHEGLLHSVIDPGHQRPDA